MLAYPSFPFRIFDILHPEITAPCWNQRMMEGEDRTPGTTLQNLTQTHPHQVPSTIRGPYDRSGMPNLTLVPGLLLFSIPEDLSTKSPMSWDLDQLQWTQQYKTNSFCTFYKHFNIHIPCHLVGYPIPLQNSKHEETDF